MKKASVQFVRAKFEAIEHLKKTATNDKVTDFNRFEEYMAKIITEMKGEIKRHEFKRPDGVKVKPNVVMFKDGSFAHVPTWRDMER